MGRKVLFAACLSLLAGAIFRFVRAIVCTVAVGVGRRIGTVDLRRTACLSLLTAALITIEKAIVGAIANVKFVGTLNERIRNFVFVGVVFLVRVVF